jgi:hypothetical protein
MKIYFSGAIRGGRQNVMIYKQLIEMLDRYGQVLTEHIGQSNLTGRGETLTDTEIYRRDIEWLERADLIVADVSIPSLGVGYEIARAEHLGKKIVCLYHNASENHLSAMISGNSNLTVHRYDTPQALDSMLKEMISSM